MGPRVCGSSDEFGDRRVGVWVTGWACWIRAATLWQRTIHAAEPRAQIAAIGTRLVESRSADRVRRLRSTPVSQIPISGSPERLRELALLPSETVRCLRSAIADSSVQQPRAIAFQGSGLCGVEGILDSTREHVDQRSVPGASS